MLYSKLQKINWGISGLLLLREFQSMKKKTGKFYNYFYNKYQRSKVSEQEYFLAADTAGRVYCLNQKSGLSWYDTKGDTFRVCNQPQQNSPISKIIFDEDNHLWMLNGNGGLDI